MQNLAVIMFENKKNNLLTVAFYNVENLFDTKNDPYTNDNEFTGAGKLHWTKRKYLRKLKNISSIVSLIGTNNSSLPPAIVGLAEVENATVLHDLTTHPNLIEYRYKFIHFESLDERGMDVALLYRVDSFTVLSSKTHTFHFYDEDGTRDYTRDVLEVKGVLHGDLVYILVNHWQSRLEGKAKTNTRRVEAATFVQQKIQEIKANEKVDPKFIIMGDFNDDPSSESIKDYLVKEHFFNPMEDLHQRNSGSLNYYGRWHLFDQIILSKNFFSKNSSLAFQKASIFKKPWMKIQKGKYKGSPLRTYIGPWYKGGYSDHFPVYVTFEKK